MTAVMTQRCVASDDSGDCERAGDFGRGLCGMHYHRAWRAGTLEVFPVPPPFVNPMVCVCDEPDADLARDFGMCQVCKRKPLALMAVAS